MRVACVVVPRFPVEVERLHDPSLRGRPVVVGGAPEERKDVVDCSLEAMERGVRPGMTLREALSRCAEAAFVEARPERYRATALAMVNALLELSPLVELADAGVVYVGIDSGFPGEMRPKKRTARSVEEDAMEAELAETIATVAEAVSGLNVRVGVADGKFAAYVAAVLASPSGRGRREAPGEGADTNVGVGVSEPSPPSLTLLRKGGGDRTGTHHVEEGTLTPALSHSQRERGQDGRPHSTPERERAELP